MVFNRSLFMILILAFLLSLGFFGCGNKSDQSETPALSFTADNLASQGHWVYGAWDLQGMPASWGDLGADIRKLKITPQEMSYEIFGHLAAESYLFNTDGFDFGGNCLFRVRSTTFGMKSDTSGVISFYVGNPRYELVDDPGNRDDCAKQVSRINSVIGHEHQILTGFERIDDQTFSITPQGLIWADEKKVYRRADHL